MRCHDVDFQILGDDMQLVEIELDPGESVIAEAGSQDKRIGVAVVNDRDGTVGAVGVSGAAPQQDEELAQAAADAFGSRAQQRHSP